MSLILNIDGDTRIIRNFDEAIRRIGSPEILLDETGEKLMQEYVDNFAEEGKRLEPKEWQELAEFTKDERERLGYGREHPILERTGKLRDGFRKQVSKFSVRVFNPVDYFKYHQTGTPKMPQRRMISFPERLKQEVIAGFTKFINYALNRR